MSRDGAVIALDWEVPRVEVAAVNTNVNANARRAYIENGPISESIVLILHGVNTDSSFGYIRSVMNTCTQNGFIAVGMNARGCGGVSLATPRLANSAYTNDLR